MGRKSGPLASSPRPNGTRPPSPGRDAWVEGAGAGLALLVSGLTVWVVLLLAVHATAGGELDRVPLAVVVLTALAAFEAVDAAARRGVTAGGGAPVRGPGVRRARRAGSGSRAGAPATTPRRVRPRSG